jgi:hypothetical protein
MNTVQQVNILSPEFKANPFTLLAEFLRDRLARIYGLSAKPPGGLEV